LKAWGGNGAAYDCATIYAQWGSVTQALAWLETALRQPDANLEGLKIDPLTRSAAQRAVLPGDRAGVEVSALSGGAVPTQFLSSLEERSNVRYVEN